MLGACGACWNASGSQSHRAPAHLQVRTPKEADGPIDVGCVRLGPPDGILAFDPIHNHAQLGAHLPVGPLLGMLLEGGYQLVPAPFLGLWVKLIVEVGGGCTLFLRIGCERGAGCERGPTIREDTKAARHGQQRGTAAREAR